MEQSGIKIRNRISLLPGLRWFRDGLRSGDVGQIYSGSYGTDANCGCLGKTTLDYRVFIQRKDNCELLYACCTVHPAWNARPLMQTLSAARFFADEMGLSLAEQWLSNEFLRFDILDKAESHCYECSQTALPFPQPEPVSVPRLLNGF